MVSVRKRLKQLAAKTGVDEIDDLASGARSWLARNVVDTGAVRQAGDVLSDMGNLTQTNLILAKDAITNPRYWTDTEAWRRHMADVSGDNPSRMTAPMQGALREGDRPSLLSLGSSAADTTASFKNLGAPVREPLIYGARRALGAADEPGAGPLSGENLRRAREELKGQNPAVNVLGQAGLGALEFVTDPSTYAAGIGFTGKGAGLGKVALRSAEYGALSGGGGALGEEVAGDTGKMVGGIATPLGVGIARGMLARRKPSPVPEDGVAGITDQSPLRSRLKELAAAPADGEVSLHAGVPLKEGVRAAAQHGKFIGPAAGMATGYSQWDEDDSYWDRALKVAAGGAAGYVAGTVAKGATTPKPARDVDFLTTDISERLDDIGKDIIAMRQTTGGPLSLIGAMRRAFRSGSISAHQVKGSVDQLGEVVERAFRDGHIIPTSTGAADVARLRAWVAANKAKLSPALRQRWEDTGTVPAEFILDHWNDRATGAANFQVLLSAPKEVHDAVAGLQGFWKKVESTESALGVPHQTLVDDYLPRAYKPDAGVGRKGTGGGHLRSRQGFQRERKLPTMLEALERQDEKLLAAWETVGDLFEYRLRAGTRAMAHAQVKDALIGNNWVHYGPKAPDPSNWQRMSIPEIQKIYPYVDRSEAKRILDEFAAGLISENKAAEALSEAADTARMPLWVKSDIADELSTALHAAFADSRFEEAVRPLSAFVNHLKGIRLAVDVAMTGREAAALTGAGATAGGVRSTLNPVAWARASSGIWRAFETAVTRGGTDDFFRDPENRRIANLIGIGGKGSENPILGYEQGQYGFGALPKVGKVTGALEDFQFNHLIPAMQVETFKEVVKNMANSGKYRGMPLPQVEEIAADFIRKATGNVDLVALGHGPVMRTLERLGLLSAGWTHGILGLVTGALPRFKTPQATVRGIKVGGQFGPQNADAQLLYRRFWAGMALASVTTAAGLSVLLTGDASPEHIWELLDPFGQDSVTNPNGRGFLKVEMPDGIRVDLWGPLTPVFRAATAPLDTGAQEFQRAPDKDSKEGLWWAAWAGLKGAAGIAGEGYGAVDTIPSWFKARRSMPIGIVMDLNANKDFRRRMIADEDTEEGNWLDRLKFIGGQLPPGFSESFGLTTEESPTPELAFGTRNTIARGVGSFFGLNVSTPQRDPAAIKGKVEDFLRSQGTHGGLDPIGKLRRAEDVDTAAKQRFLAENPDVVEYIRQKRRESAKGLGVLVGKEAARLYNAQVAELQTERDQAIRQLGELRRTNQISGNEYRDRVSEAWDRYVFGKDALAESVLGVDSPEAAQKKLEGFYGKRTAENDMDLLLNKWYSIRPADDSRAARDATAQERTAFVEGLDPATKQRFLEYRRNTAKSVGGDVYAAYFDAQQVYGEYAKISPYIGMDVAQARKVQDLLERARQRRHMTGLPQGAAIMLDGQADITTKVLAQRAQGGKLSNPQRQQFWRQHADKLGPFYTDIISEMAEDMTG